MATRDQRLGVHPGAVRLIALFALILVLLATAACGDDGDGAPTDTTTGTPAASSAKGSGDGDERSTNTAEATAESERLVREDSPVLGPASAPVTVVEFLDPECEYCRAAFPVVKALLDEYPGEIRLVVRYLPLHGNSLLAVQATEAAGEQGKYAEMQELLFERQPEWGEKDESQEELFGEYARELGLDVDRFTAAMENPDYREKAERDQADAAALGVRGTPTFFVDGKWISEPSYKALKAAIDEVLER